MSLVLHNVENSNRPKTDIFSFSDVYAMNRILGMLVSCLQLLNEKSWSNLEWPNSLQDLSSEFLGLYVSLRAAKTRQEKRASSKRQFYFHFQLCLWRVRSMLESAVQI